jgi:hypothetical protein
VLKHQAGEGDEMQAHHRLRQPFVILDEAPEARRPGEGALHDRHHAVGQMIGECPHTAFWTNLVPRPALRSGDFDLLVQQQAGAAPRQGDFLQDVEGDISFASARIWLISA